MTFDISLVFIWTFPLIFLLVKLQNKFKRRIRSMRFSRNVRVARNSLDSDGPMVSGGDVLRHALKNELAKISLCSRNIEASGPKFDAETFQQYIGENAKNIQTSADYLLTLIKRIQNLSREITIIESVVNFVEIIEDAVNRVFVYLQAEKITMKRNYSPAQITFFFYVMPYT